MRFNHNSLLVNAIAILAAAAISAFCGVPTWITIMCMLIVTEVSDYFLGRPVTFQKAKNAD